MQGFTKNVKIWLLGGRLGTCHQIQAFQRFSWNSAETQCNKFENLKANLFWTDILTDKASDPDTNFYNKKLQELDSEYYSVEE